MHRRPYAPRGGGRGSSRGSGSRGGYRGAHRGSSNPAGRTSVSIASLPATSSAPQRPRSRLSHGCFLQKQIFRHFNPSAESCDSGSLSTINSSEEKPDGIGFALIYVANQPQWMTENTIYVKSHLDLLPEYVAKKAILLEQHKEPTHEEMMERVIAMLTESIKFGQYGIEDGPDMECFDEEGNISSLLVPGDWMDESRELPNLATVDTPSVKYSPAEQNPIAVFAGYGLDPGKTGFKFVSWFLVEEIELFVANSDDLARKMHDKKWSADMNHEWAAVKLRRVEKGEPQWRPYPFIRRGAGKLQVPGSEPKETNGDISAEGIEDTADSDPDGGQEPGGAHDQETGIVCENGEQTAVDDSESKEPEEHDGPEALLVKEDQDVLEIKKADVEEETGKQAELEVEEKVEEEVKEVVKEEVEEEDKNADKVEGEEEAKEEIKRHDNEGAKDGQIIACETKEEEHDEPTAVVVDNQVEDVGIKDGQTKEEEAQDKANEDKI